MEIKWHDKSGGSVKNERWVKIPEGKAHEMLRRRFPQAIDDILRELRNGREVRCPDYSMRDETASKTTYVQNSDDDDYPDTVTFFPSKSVASALLDEFEAKGPSKLRKLVMDLDVVNPPIVLTGEPVCLTAVEVEARTKEFFANWPRGMRSSSEK